MFPLVSPIFPLIFLISPNFPHFPYNSPYDSPNVPYFPPLISLIFPILKGAGIGFDSIRAAASNLQLRKHYFLTKNKENK